MHRVVWNLRYPLPASLIPGTAYDERAPRGVMAVPGVYTVKLTAGGTSATAPLTVQLDPRVPATQQALVAEFTLATKLMDMLGELHATSREIGQARSQIARLGSQGGKAAEAVDREAGDILDTMAEPKAKAGIDLLNYAMHLNARIAYLEDEVDFGDGAPTQQFGEMADQYRQELDKQLTRWKILKDTALPRLNDELRQTRAGAGDDPVRASRRRREGGAACARRPGRRRRGFRPWRRCRLLRAAVGADFDDPGPPSFPVRLGQNPVAAAVEVEFARHERKGCPDSLTKPLPAPAARVPIRHTPFHGSSRSFHLIFLQIPESSCAKQPNNTKNRVRKWPCSCARVSTLR